MHPSWKEKLQPIRELGHEAYWKAETKRIQGHIIYPTTNKIFNAFNMPFEDVKVVIIGQDPYHGPNQANGLAFSVNKGIAVPPSLQNIYQELSDDLGIKSPTHGDLSDWVKQGVMLLNTSLTVEAGKAGSHKDIGWMPFIQGVISILNEYHENLVFILWGKHAQQFRAGMSTNRHYYIESAHPSPFSADRGFFGSKPFSQCNTFLRTINKQPIDWEIK